MTVRPDIRVLLACDLDGTLLAHDGLPAPGIVEALAELRAAGAPLVVCTGRPYPGTLRATALLNAEPVALVCYHGGLVVDTASGGWLQHLTIPDASAAALVRGAEAGGLAVTSYVGEARFDLSGPMAAAAHKTPAPSSGITRLVLAGDHGVIAAALPGLVSAWAPALRIELIRPGVIAAVSGRVDKGEALRLVAAHLEVPLEQFVACGDSAGDESLLRVAGVRIAVGDAPEALRRLAATVVSQARLAETLRALVLPLL